MIKFRQKLFRKPAKNIIQVVKKSFEDNPVGLTLTTIGTAGTGVNMALNVKRKNNEKEFYDKQIKSTKKLTKSLNKMYEGNDEVLRSLEEYHKEHTKTPPKDPTSEYIDAVVKGSNKTHKLKRNTK